MIVWLGTLINLGSLWLWHGKLKIPLPIAGAMAIELAIIHNFNWFYFRLWRGRVQRSPRDYFLRLIKYNLATASIDFIVNLGILYYLNTYCGFHYLVADIIGMLAGPIFKFTMNEFVIFRKKATVTESTGHPDE